MKSHIDTLRDINDMDRLSDLPDFVILHIMEFMNIKDAVQTCLLSKRWKNLWKSLTNLTLHDLYSDKIDIFSKFVSGILSGRDGSVPLHNIDFIHSYPPETTLLELINYAVSHNVQQCTIDLHFNPTDIFEFPLSIFSCRSLTFLKLDFWICYEAGDKIKLPALKNLYLKFVTFSTCNNGCAEPFSTCNMLNTLLIVGCYLQRDAQALCLTNSNLSSLTIGSTYLYQEAHSYKVVLCAPKLSSVTAQGCSFYQVSSVCNLPFLEKVKIDVLTYYNPSEGLVLMGWLQVFTNVKTMTLSSRTLKLLEHLSNRGSVTTQPPCFVRLKSLEVESESFSTIFDEKSMIVKYLLQNSPLAKVDIITHTLFG